MTIEAAGTVSLWIAFFASTLRVSTPLLLAGMGGLLSERSGITHIALEGAMLIGGFSAAVFAHEWNSAWWGLGAGFIFGCLFGAAYALFAVYLKTNQIVTGTALNFFALGITPVLCKIFYDVTLATPSLALEQRLPALALGLGWIILILVHFCLKHLHWGLWLRFAGERPAALSANGISVSKVRFASVTVGSGLAGLGGALLAVCLSSGFTRGMTAGRGFMALAALILGRWKPIPTALACLLFGAADALQIRLQGVELSWFEGKVFSIPIQWVQALPYLITIAVLAIGLGRARAPSALGKSE